MSAFKLGKKLVNEIHDLDAEGIARHPHQRRRLVIFGLLIAALSLSAGFALIHSERTSASDILIKVGAKSMSASELQKTMSARTVSWKPYWIGAITGYRYEADTSDNKEILIRYIQLAGDPSVSGTNIYTVESYENLESFKADVLRKDFSTDSEFLINGRTGRYVDATRTFLMVRMADNKEVFEIHFAHPKTVPQLEQMAASLVPVE